MVPTADQYLRAFTKCQTEIRSRQKLLDAHMSMPIENGRHVATMTKLADAVGYKNFNAANLHYGTLAQIIGKSVGFSGVGDCWVTVLIEFVPPEETESGHWELLLRPEVAEAWTRFMAGESA